MISMKHQQEKARRLIIIRISQLNLSNYKNILTLMSNEIKYLLQYQMRKKESNKQNC